MKWINFKQTFNFYGKYSKTFFVKLIYLISRVFFVKKTFHTLRWPRNLFRLRLYNWLFEPVHREDLLYIHLKLKKKWNFFSLLAGAGYLLIISTKNHQNKLKELRYVPRKLFAKVQNFVKKKVPVVGFR